MKLFYEPEILQKFSLNEEESRHCKKVLRLKEGDIIYITDGKGSLFKSEILEISEKKTYVNILETKNNFEKRPYNLHIAIAPTKNIERIEWFVEKTTEIGIDKISFLLCENSERKLIKTERLNKIIEAAMKQSYKTYHPLVSEMIKFEDFIKNNSSQQKFIAHCEDSNKEYLANLIQKKSDYIILIGPEGDFSTKEIALALEYNFLAISLSNSRLRTETAAIVACDIISIINNL